MSWNIKTPGDYINGPLTVMGAVTLNSTFTVSGVSRFFSTGDGLFVSGNAGPDLYTIGVNYYNNSGTESVQVSPRPSWKIEHKNSSDALAYFDIGFRAANAAAGTFTSRFKIDGSGNAGFSVAPFANARVAISGATSVNTSNYIGASTWAARFIGNSNGAASGISLLSYSAAGLETPASLHVVPVTDYRSGLVATYSADASGSGYFAINQFVPTSSSTVERLRVDRDGNVGINVVPSLSKSACLHLVSGIAFPATQTASADANTLDDYEEGSFTPVIQGSTTAGTATYVTRYGYYTKVGRLVTVNIFIDWNSHTGTGDTRIAGLPFTNSSTFSAATIGYANSIAVTANYMISAYVDASNSWILLNQIPTGGGGNTTVPIDTAGAFVISASYII